MKKKKDTVEILLENYECEGQLSFNTDTTDLIIVEQDLYKKNKKCDNSNNNE